MQKFQLFIKAVLYLLAFIGGCVAITTCMASSIYLRNQADDISVILGWALFLLTLVLAFLFICKIAIWIGKAIKHFDPDFNPNN